MYKSFLLLFLIFNDCQAQHQTDLIKINELSEVIREISGITILSDNYLYAINDSGNSNTVFCMNQEGNIIHEFTIPNTKNIDWEDITYDHNDTLYIGDFGNNANDRKDLTIYKVSGILSDVINTTTIKFSLEDQKKYPPKKNKRNFDIEAFVFLNGSFYLFTKNRSKDFDGLTKLYKIPAQEGKHVARLITTYKIGNDYKDCFITGAAIHPKGNKIALLTYNKLIILSDFDGDNVFNGHVEKIKLNHYSQKEGVCFKNDSTILITDESNRNHPASLYEYHL